MNGRTVARLLLVLVLAGVAVGIGAASYNAGLTAGLIQSGQVVVTPAGHHLASYVGWGVGPGFGFFGFVGFLFVLFLVLGLARAAFGGGRRGWGPGGPGGPRGWRSEAWERQIRETHDALHRDAGQTPDEPART
jgi:hypothetical protein